MQSVNYAQFYRLNPGFGVTLNLSFCEKIRRGEWVLKCIYSNLFIGGAAGRICSTLIALRLNGSHVLISFAIKLKI